MHYDGQAEEDSNVTKSHLKRWPVFHTKGWGAAEQIDRCLEGAVSVVFPKISKKNKKNQPRKTKQGQWSVINKQEQID